MTARRQITIRIGTLRLAGMSEGEIPGFRAALRRALARDAATLAGSPAAIRPATTRAEAAAASVLAAVRRRMPP